MVQNRRETQKKCCLTVFSLQEAAAIIMSSGTLAGMQGCLVVLAAFYSKQYAFDQASKGCLTDHRQLDMVFLVFREHNGQKNPKIFFLGSV